MCFCWIDTLDHMYAQKGYSNDNFFILLFINSSLFNVCSLSISYFKFLSKRSSTFLTKKKKNESVKREVSRLFLHLTIGIARNPTSHFQIVAFGLNHMGQIGLGTKEYVSSPTVAKIFKEKREYIISCSTANSRSVIMTNNVRLLFLEIAFCTFYATLFKNKLHLMNSTKMSGF